MSNFIPYDEIITETDKAILFDFDNEEIWFSKAQIYVDKPNKEVEIPQWLQKKEGLTR